MIENILLTACRSPFLDNDRIYPPLGILYLHQAIKENYPDLKVWVTDEPSPRHLITADLVGISIMTPQREEAKRLLKEAQHYNYNSIKIAGGPHVKNYIKSMMGEDWNYLIPNDGIRAINKIIENPQHSKLVINDFIKPKEYQKLWRKPNRLDNKDFLNKFNYKLNNINSTTMLTSQGCSEHCTFCEEAISPIRWTPLDIVKEELNDIVSLGYKGVYIFDDIFALSEKYTQPITAELYKLGLIYRCNGQARRFNKDFAKLLGSTGCVEIAFGAESGSQKILDTVRKKCTVAQNYNFVKLSKKEGMKVKAFLMIGLPGETRETIKETEAFIKNSGIDDFQLAIYYPYKGTQIREEMDNNKDIDLFFLGEGLGAYGQKNNQSEAVIRTNQLSQEDLINERDRLITQYKIK